MEQVDSTEVRETRMVIGYSHARWRATHCKPHLTKSDVRLTLPQQPSDPHQNGLSGTFERSECAGFRSQGGCSGTSGRFLGGIRCEAIEFLEIDPGFSKPVPGMPDEGSLLNIVGTGTGTAVTFSGQTDANGIDDHPNAQTNANWDISGMQTLDLRCRVEEGQVYVPAVGGIFQAFCAF